MPQRRSFAPMPMNQPTRQPVPHGRAQAGGFGQPQQPLPPGPLSGNQPPDTSQGGGLRVPSSVPLNPAMAGGPIAPLQRPQAPGTGTLDPFNAQAFLQARGGQAGPINGPQEIATGSVNDARGSQGNPFGGHEMLDEEGFHLPHESTTTALDLQGGTEGHSNNEFPTALLKMLGALK